jgi:3-oxoadipate enol-lactonase
MSDRGGALDLDGSLDGPAGLPVLVLGNSLGTTRAMWDPQASALARHFRLLRFDWPGHGSPAPQGPLSIEKLSQGVLGLLDRFGVTSAAYTGLSLGGMIGIWLAAHAPGRIHRLALCCTSARLDLAWAQRAATVRGQGMGPVADATADRWFTRAFQQREPGTVAAIVGRMREVAPEGYAGCCDAIGAMDQRASLAGITAPTLVIAGSEDPATPPWHGAVIARAVPGARLTVIRGASHLANVSQPAEMTALLLGHLLS